MQKRSDLSGFFANRTGAPHGDNEGLIAPASNNSFIYILMSNCS